MRKVVADSNENHQSIEDGSSRRILFTYVKRVNSAILAVL